MRQSVSERRGGVTLSFLPAHLVCHSQERPMEPHAPPPFEEIGYWSEVKLDIIREYAQAYSRILTAQRRFHHVYIDAFAGAGVHVSRTTGEEVAGSPLNAVNIDPPFREYHLIDLNGDKVGYLRG